MVWQQSAFGSIDVQGKPKEIKQFSWKNQNDIAVEIITYGAAIRAIKVPDKNGIVQDVVTGFDQIDGYRSAANRFFGATAGRAANRLYKGVLRLNNETYALSTNHPTGNHLHGGFIGFDKVVWEHFVEGNTLVLSYYSRDLEEGYPGDFIIHTKYQVTEQNQLVIQYQAITTKVTFVNVTNHSYFNLAGHASGPEELYNHVISINADKITEVDSGSIPTGNLLNVSGTVFDLRVPQKLGNVINKVPNSPGFDFNYCINRSSEESISFVASAFHPGSGRLMEVYGNQPGLQFYTANFLPETPTEGFSKDRQPLYKKHGAFCMESQKWPDAPNHKEFPSAILNPGQTYNHTVIYKFLVRK